MCKSREGVDEGEGRRGRGMLNGLAVDEALVSTQATERAVRDDMNHASFGIKKKSFGIKKREMTRMGGDF